MSTKFKISKKHRAIFDTITKTGYYRPGYSDQEPATATLIKQGILEWRKDFRGVEFTEYGKQFINQLK